MNCSMASPGTLIDSKVDALVIMTGPALLAARRQTSTVPIVMAVSSDGVGTVGVASLVRPGGNVTGLTLMSPDLAGLRLSLLKDAVPAAKRIAVLYNPAERVTADELRQTEVAAGKLGVVLQPVETHSGDALDQAFANAVSGGADAFITFSHRFSLSHRSRIAALAVQHRLPAMYGWREFAEAGGLMVYGPNVATRCTARRPLSTAFSRAATRRKCRSSSRRSLSSSSTSRPPGRSDLKFQPRCWCAPTR